MSMQCLTDNDYDRDKCSLYFLNYRNCLKFWVFIHDLFSLCRAEAETTI